MSTITTGRSSFSATDAAPTATAAPAGRRSGRRRGRLVSLVLAVACAFALIVPATQANASSAAELKIELAVRNMINAERKAYHLPALKLSLRLAASAHLHDAAMVRTNVLSHQLPGEANIGARISKTGLDWTYCEENVAWTTDRTTRGAVNLNGAMFNEKAPNNGHRLNILNSSIQFMGVDVLLDSRHGKLWITEDFARVA